MAEYVFNYRKALFRIKKEFLRIQLKNYKMGIYYASINHLAPYAPLSAATIAEKNKKGYPLDVLYATGHLESQYKASFNTKDMSILIYNNASYAGFHQFGGKVFYYGAWRDVPARPVVSYGKEYAESAVIEMKKETIRQFRAYVKRVFKRGF